MSDIAGHAVNKMVDTADAGIDNIINVIEAAADVALTTATGALVVGEKTFDQAMEEIRATKASLVNLLKATGHAVTAPLPGSDKPTT